MTSDGIQPQMENDLKWNTTSNGKWPKMEDNFKWKITLVFENGEKIKKVMQRKIRRVRPSSLNIEIITLPPLAAASFELKIKINKNN